MKVIFLDIDGVLNNTATVKAHVDTHGNALNIDPSLVARLNAIVVRSGAKVVISSTWRRAFSLPEITAMLLRSGFVGDAIDMTPIRNKRPRVEEIASWLGDNTNVESFIILDDDPALYYLKSHLILTDSSQGLSSDHVEQAIAMLSTIRKK